MTWSLLLASCALGASLTAQASFELLPRTEPPSSIRSCIRPQLVDLNGDRRLDFAGAGFRTVLNFGSGRMGEYRPHYGFPGLECEGGGWPGFGDVNGDGFMDMVSGSPPSLVARPCYLPKVWLGDALGGLTYSPTSMPGDLAPGRVSTRVFDVDGDMDLDAVVLSFFARPDFLSHVYLNDGTGTFVLSHARSFLMPGSGADQAHALDLDLDGDLDLYADGVPASAVFLNDGNGFFTLTQTLPAHTHLPVRFGDVDGDGDLDMMRARDAANGSPLLYLNDGTGYFAPEPLRTPGDSTEFAGSFGDVDEDGDLDYVLVRDPPQPTAVPGEYRVFEQWLNDGGGWFTRSTAPMPSISESFAMPDALEVADLDGDGDLDGFACGEAYGSSANPRFWEVLWNTKRHLYAPHEPRLGGTYDLQVWADEFHLVALLLSFQPGYLDLGDMGVYRLDPLRTLTAATRVMDASRTTTYSFPVGTNPALLGLTIHSQAIDFDPSGVGLDAIRLTAEYVDTVVP